MTVTIRRALEAGTVRTMVRRMGGPQSRWGLYYWNWDTQPIINASGKKTLAPKGWTRVETFGPCRTEREAIKEAIKEFGNEPEGSKNYKRSKKK